MIGRENLSSVASVSLEFVVASATFGNDFFVLCLPLEVPLVASEVEAYVRRNGTAG